MEQRAEKNNPSPANDASNPSLSRRNEHQSRIINPNPSLNLDQNHIHQQEIHEESNPDPDPAQVPNSTFHGASSNFAPPPPHPPQESSNEGVRYRECLKNHAANMGGHVVDGCGEFMPNGEGGTPGALRCAACDCHRNFHRRETDGSHPQPPTNHPPSYLAPPSHSVRSMRPPARQQHHKYPHTFFHGATASPSTPAAPIMMSFGGNGGATAESSSEDLNIFQCSINEGQGVGQSSFGKKRFRTKFTQEQKEKMHDFAEKLGWKIQKQDEQEVQQFCYELGIKRQVLKVWMHNNKKAMKKKEM